MLYNFKAFDNYDFILTAGPHHNNEIKKNEKVYNLSPKNRKRIMKNTQNFIRKRLLQERSTTMYVNPYKTS